MIPLLKCPNSPWADFVMRELHEGICSFHTGGRSGVALPRYVVHFETFEIIHMSFGNMAVLEKHCLLGLVYVGNMSLDDEWVSTSSPSYWMVHVGEP